MRRAVAAIYVAILVRQPKPILGVNLFLSGIVFFMIDYKRVRHAFSENAGWHPSILEHFEILAPLTHPPVNKSAYIAFSGPYISKTRKTHKADIHQPNSKYSKDFRNNIQTHSHFSNGPSSPLKVSDLFKNDKLFSVFRIFRTLIPQDGKVAQPSHSSMSKSFM